MIWWINEQTSLCWGTGGCIQFLVFLQGTLLWTASVPQRSASRYEPVHIFQWNQMTSRASLPRITLLQAFRRDSPVVSWSSGRGQEISFHLCSRHPCAFKWDISGPLYWDCLLLNPCSLQLQTLIIIFPQSSCSFLSWKNNGSETAVSGSQLRVPTLPPPLSSCVTLGTLLKISVLRFPSHKLRVIMVQPL